MAVPLVVILGVFIWMFTTFVKWHIAKDYQYQNKIDKKTLEQLQRGSMTDEKFKEAFGKFREKQAAEEQSRINKSYGKGKTLIDEVEERMAKGKGQRAEPKNQKNQKKYTPDMFHDTVSRMHEELMKKGKCNQTIL